MKAVVYTRYGSPDVLQLREVAKPVPSADQVLIRVAAASVNGSDKEGLVGSPLYARIGGLRDPRRQILGSDVAGRVEQVGSEVREFQVGEQVFGELPGYRGGFAEFACAPARSLLRIPPGLTADQAAAIPQAGVIALQAMRHGGQVRPGRRVLINGAGGSAGIFALQLAKLDGAEVTAVDHGDKLEFLRSLGADHVIDYTKQQFTQTGEQFDLILDVIGHGSALAYARSLRPNGTYFFIGGSVATLLGILTLGPLITLATGKRVRLLVVNQNRNDLSAIAELCAAGQVVPVIDSRFPLHEVPEALARVLAGRHQGKVVITFPDAD